MNYSTFVIDNYSAPDPDASSTGPSFLTWGAAVAWAVAIVDGFLEGELARGTAPEDLWERFTTFGESPVICGAELAGVFDAWAYARARCEQLSQVPEKGNEWN